jgi:hypothetical protein
MFLSPVLSPTPDAGHPASLAKEVWKFEMFDSVTKRTLRL